MKRIAHYRRTGRKLADGSQSPCAGLRERMVWALWPDKKLTGSQLAERFGITLAEFTRALGGKEIEGRVSKIVAGERFPIPGTKKTDRLYWLNGKPELALPTTNERTAIIVSKKAIENRGDRQKSIERAKKRRKLIAAGIYIEEWEAVL